MDGNDAGYLFNARYSRQDFVQRILLHQHHADIPHVTTNVLVSDSCSHGIADCLVEDQDFVNADAAAIATELTFGAADRDKHGVNWFEQAERGHAINVGDGRGVCAAAGTKAPDQALRHDGGNR